MWSIWDRGYRSRGQLLVSSSVEEKRKRGHFRPTVYWPTAVRRYSQDSILSRSFFPSASETELWFSSLCCRLSTQGSCGRTFPGTSEKGCRSTWRSVRQIGLGRFQPQTETLESEPCISLSLSYIYLKRSERLSSTANFGNNHSGKNPVDGELPPGFRLHPDIRASERETMGPRPLQRDDCKSHLYIIYTYRAVDDSVVVRWDRCDDCWAGYGQDFGGRE